MELNAVNVMAFIVSDQLFDVHGLVNLYAVHESPSLAQPISVGKIDTRNKANLKRLSSLLHQESTWHLHRTCLGCKGSLPHFDLCRSITMGA